MILNKGTEKGYVGKKDQEAVILEQADVREASTKVSNSLEENVPASQKTPDKTARDKAKKRKHEVDWGRRRLLGLAATGAVTAGVAYAANERGLLDQFKINIWNMLHPPKGTKLVTTHINRKTQNAGDGIKREGTKLEQEKQEALQRADIAYASHMNCFFNPETGLFVKGYNPLTRLGKIEANWEQSINAGAVMAYRILHSADLQSAQDVKRAMEAYEYYWVQDAQGYNPDPLIFNGSASNRIYFDDEAWTLVEMLQGLQEYSDMKDSNHILERVKIILADADKNWDREGGVLWRKIYTGEAEKPEYVRYRGIVSNAPLAQGAVAFYGITNEEKYLDQAKKIYSWATGKLRKPNGLYANAIRPAGIEYVEVDYNEGTMIGLGVGLFNATNNQQYLLDAETTARAALQYYDEHQLLYDQAPKFTAIYLRNLLLLASVTRDTALQNQIETAIINCAEKMWNNNGFKYRYEYKDGGTTETVFRHPQDKNDYSYVSFSRTNGAITEIIILAAMVKQKDKKLYARIL